MGVVQNSKGLVQNSKGLVLNYFIFHCKPNLAKSLNLFSTSFHEILLITFLVLTQKFWELGWPPLPLSGKIPKKYQFRLTPFGPPPFRLTPYLDYPHLDDWEPVYFKWWWTTFWWLRWSCVILYTSRWKLEVSLGVVKLGLLQMRVDPFSDTSSLTGWAFLTNKQEEIKKYF